MRTNLAWALATLALAAAPSPSLAQRRPAASTDRYFAPPAPPPRVVHTPAPSGNRDDYATYGGAAGAAAAVALTRNPYAPIAGGMVGTKAGQAAYDGMGQDRYYYPAPYGVQTTTPYATRPRKH